MSYLLHNTDVTFVTNINIFSMKISNNPQRTELMSVIWKIQRKKRFISHDDITKIAKVFNLSRMEVEGVVTFYHFFHRTHAGNYTIYLNDSIVGKQAGMDEIKQVFEKELGIKTGQVTEDKMFGLFETSCIGLSDMEPACLINFKPFVNLTPEKVRYIIRSLKDGKKAADICDVPKSNIRYTPGEKTVFFKDYDSFSALRYLNDKQPEDIIELIKQSKLAGRGGAFFPTGLKWQFARQNKADKKYLICNADEGEPGTFKDRVLMQEKPELLIEGMILSAYAIGATEGYIYLRGEYLYLKDQLEKVIQDYRDKGYLGKNIAGRDFNFDIHIHMGAGAYVCGEETALIHSMEGKRGEPGTKEYFPVERGFLNKPTVVNNVETLCAVTKILDMGVENWLALGTENTPGTKIFSVSGDCKYPGIYEIEWGMKIKDLLELAGAENTNFILQNGYAGGCLHPLDFQRELSGEGKLPESDQLNTKNPESYQKMTKDVGVQSGGAFMIFNKDRNILEIIKNVEQFFVNESCGVCVPCRVGNYLLNIKLHKILSGKASKTDLKELIDWSKIIKTNSRCGLGILSSNALMESIRKFPQVYDTLTGDSTQKNGKFDLDKATKEYKNIITEIYSDYE